MGRAKYKRNKSGYYETKVWDGTYTESGAKRRIALRTQKSSKELERMVNEWNEKMQNGGALSFTSMSFYEYAKHWLDVSKAAREINTRKGYENVINVHLSFLGDVPVAEIRHSHFQQAINNQLEHPATCRKIYITFRQIIKSAIRDRLLPRGAFDDICEDISLPHYVKAQKRPLTASEKEALHKATFTDRERAFAWIIYCCGLRKGEALALTRFDFNWSSRTLSITKSIIFPEEKGVLKPYPKSDRGIRTLPIPDIMVDKVKTFVESSEGGLLFHNRGENYITKTGYRRMWQKIIASMNKVADTEISGLTAHIFRHNYCTELCYLVPKVSTKKIAALLGDSERMVIEVYSHILEEKEDVSGLLNSALAV